ncbi:LysE family translocator [Neptuniibacter sp. QD34_54]|uniref:LysE family translocator n=1 Tax=Neptuniibacter sp. QD34_54 TaxID=3398208 RepID=UPI0039F4BC4F
MQEIITFSIVALLLVISPGPNGVLIVKTASVQGRTASFANVLGLFTATFFHGAFSILGLSALLLQSAELFFVIKLLGALYLFYIGAKAIYQSFLTPVIDQADAQHTANNKRAKSLLGSFIEGFLTQLLNPKVSMFYLAAFPQFVQFGSSSYLAAFVLVAIHAVIIAFWFIGMTLMIDKLKARSKHSSAGRWVQRISGSVMIYFSSLLIGHKA